ncbi:selenoprotein Pb-like L homeolog precursor [Xenopus laevis]|uniref:Selenoprotein P N-terminal domain-containing protein n=2 Tax=Xenopus laevis TaxID=8355 RepID=A0A974HNY7_XENLA|nr:selenoprotein Pb-like L homeolog precursor [Xenopus laevis]OCT84920.1 hypothetical protein XELAEV_18023080mg [Xenopus laevis]
MHKSVLMISALMGLLGLVSSSEQTNSSICKPSPKWSIDGEVPMAEALGNVTVVALLQASCGFCLIQAARMGPLRDKLYLQGMTDIKYLIVNDQSKTSTDMFPELKRWAPKGIPVYQQTPGQEDVWDLLNGNKDDFLIYDRCGRLTFHIRLPLSFLHFPYVEAAIKFTYNESFCGNCSFTSNSTLMPMNETALLSLSDNSSSPLPNKDGPVNKEPSKTLEKNKDHKKLDSDRRPHDHSQHQPLNSHTPQENQNYHPRNLIKTGAQRPEN